MGAPQIIIIVLYSFAFGISLAQYVGGKREKIWPTILGVAFNVGLMWWGGFFG